MLDIRPQNELPTVLLIDDDLISREVSATLLTLMGYTVHSAENGAASLKMIEAGDFRPGIILLDAQMPGLSGIELVRELRAAAHSASIYILSGAQPSAELSAVVDGVLLKPFDITALCGLLENDGPGRVHAGRSHLDSGNPVVSPQTLGQFRELMPREAVREIYETMVADLSRRIEALGAAIDRHDVAEIRRIGHAIKGGCGMAGAVQAARLGALLENLSSVPEDDSFDDSRALLEDLRAAARALEHMLEDELKR